MSQFGIEWSRCEEEGAWSFLFCFATFFFPSFLRTNKKLIRDLFFQLKQGNDVANYDWGVSK